MASSERVHLDHLIPPLANTVYSVEVSDMFKKEGLNHRGPSDPTLRISDIEGEWFTRIRKPDFQRETNAWSPKICVEFLDSVVKGRIIPSIILWKSEETGSIYVLDGAHRLSVLRAWMKDDWGNDHKDYYQRKNFEEIRAAADKVRSLTRRKVGAFEEFRRAFDEREKVIQGGGAPKREMSAVDFSRAAAYNDMFASNRTLTAQWEKGDYESAEQSFLRINRQGQPLEDWESTLIEFRNSSYARTIMCIASGGESGHYWPSLPDSSSSSLQNHVKDFHGRSEKIHDRLFVPAFESPVKSLTVPMMVAPAYFQKHQYLLEILPLLAERKIAPSEKQQVEILQRDNNGNPGEIVRNGARLIQAIEGGLEHLASPTKGSLSLSIVPLFYWYNHKGTYKRGLLYGFVYWLLSGTDKEIRDRKIAFSSVRDRFEYTIFEYKPEISDYERSIGAGLKSTKRMAEFYHDLVSYLLQSDRNVEGEGFQKDVLKLVDRSTPKRKRSSKKSRTASRLDKNEVNIRELFQSNIRCHICGGIADIQAGLQYDHVNTYQDTGETHPDNLKPTHPFCNHSRDYIEEMRQEASAVDLPNYYEEEGGAVGYGQQLSFLSEELFPE